MISCKHLFKVTYTWQESNPELQFKNELPTKTKLLELYKGIRSLGWFKFREVTLGNVIQIFTIGLFSKHKTNSKDG